jgi:hypothetical protein
MQDFLAIPEALDDEPWFIEAKDADPRDEFARQVAFLSMMATIAPAVDCLAIPNAGKGSDWERLRRWREGARAGALDLQMTWKPSATTRGIFFAEFKDGEKPPTKGQRDRLNLYYRQGHSCGVYRRPETLIAHLRDAGAPFIDRWGRL